MVDTLVGHALGVENILKYQVLVTVIVNKAHFNGVLSLILTSLHNYIYKDLSLIMGLPHASYNAPNRSSTKWLIS